MNQLIDSRFIPCLVKGELNDSLFITEKSGNAMARLYWYHDDNTTVYLDWLNVSETHRKKGLGKELQEIRERIGVSMGAVTSCLWVVKGSWMQDWYKRRGYVDWIDHDTETNAIWMRKQLKDYSDYQPK